MSDSRDALYRAICAEPDEDTPRLAYADLVEEEGDRLRAGFIRAQIAHARVGPDEPLAVTSRHGSADVVDGHTMPHTLPKNLPQGYCWNPFVFRRGFPWSVAVHSTAAFDPEPTIFDRAPIQALDVRMHGRGIVETLNGWPHLSRLHRLVLSLAHFG